MQKDVPEAIQNADHGSTLRYKDNASRNQDIQKTQGQQNLPAQ
jgi:hypothetical protein